MLTTQQICLALAMLALPSARGDMPALCDASGEAEFRKRVHEAGKFDLYEEYGILKTLVRSRAYDYEQNDRNIQSYQEDAATVSHLLAAIDEEFPGDRAVALYNELSRYDGIQLQNPDESRFKAHLPPTSKQQFQEKMEKCKTAKSQSDSCKGEMLKLRYHVAALGVYLDKNVEDLRAAQEKHFADLKAMMVRASLLRLRLQGYCPQNGARFLSSGPVMKKSGS